MKGEALYSGKTFQLNAINDEAASTSRVNDPLLFNPISWIEKHVNGEGNDVRAIISSTFVYSNAVMQKHALASFRSADGKHIPTLALTGRFGGAPSSAASDHNSFYESIGDDYRKEFFITEVFPKYIGEKIEGSAMDSKTSPALGVYHPKFHIIIMTHGIAISISTANMTHQCSLEGTWSQFFPRKDATAKSNSATRTPNEENDFGEYFATYLELTDEQIPQNDRMTIGKFLQVTLQEEETLRVSTIAELFNAFDFSGAEVDLVATVPGRYYMKENHEEIKEIILAQRPVKGTCGCDLKLKTCRTWPGGKKFGYERIKSLQERAERTQGAMEAEWGGRIPTVEEIVGNYLHLQPTSLGNHITDTYVTKELYMNTLLPSERAIINNFIEKHGYDNMNVERLGESQKEDNGSGLDVDEGILKGIRILWPSKERVKESLPRALGRHPTYSRSDGQRLSLMSFDAFLAMDEAKQRLYQYQANFSSLVDDVDQVLTYRAEKDMRPWDSAVATSNHLKSQMKESSVPPTDPKCTCASLQWCMLSSTCLSRGANGTRGPSTETGMKCTDPRCTNNPNARTNKEPLEPYYFECKNFELGVLFRSTVKKRILALDARCPVHGRSDGGVPYTLVTACSTTMGIAGDKTVLPAVTQVVLPLPFRLPSSRARAKMAGSGASTGRPAAPPFWQRTLREDKCGGQEVLTCLPSFSDINSDLGRKIDQEKINMGVNSWLTGTEQCRREVEEHTRMHLRTRKVLGLLLLERDIRTYENGLRSRKEWNERSNKWASLREWESYNRRVLKRGVLSLYTHGSFPEHTQDIKMLAIDARREEQIGSFFKGGGWTLSEKNAVNLFVQSFVCQVDALLHQQAQLVQLKVESEDDNVEGAFETRGAYQEEEEEEGGSGRAGEENELNGAPPAKLARVV